MKKHLLALVAIALFFSFSPAQQVRSVWNSKKSNDDKYASIKDMNKLSIADALAVAKIKFEARKNPFIKKAVSNYEALLPSQKADLEKTFPGINGWYENYASENEMKLFKFTAQIKPEILLTDLAIRNDLPPATAKDRIEYYTVRIQQELFAAENMQIAGLSSSLIKLYQSLNKSEQDSLEAAGYPALWKEQQQCYQHKQNMKTCTCGGKMAKLPELPTCNSKQLTISETKGLTFDEPTQILARLTDGDLSYVKKAKSLRLDIWGNVSQNIQKQLVFLHLAALGETRVPEGSHINLIFLWDVAEKSQSNEYLKNIGLSREVLLTIENYYSCILKADAVSDKEPLVKDTTQLTKEEEVVPDVLPQRMTYTAKNLASAVTKNLELELQDRESLDGTCLQAKAVNDSTYEVILNGCDNTKQVFPIAKFEVPGIADFFNYCSNKIARELASIPSDLVKGYDVTVTGTADQLSYTDNEGLARNRANYIIQHLGRNVKAEKITPAIEIDLPVGKRFVSLKFTLKSIHTGTVGI